MCQLELSRNCYTSESPGREVHLRTTGVGEGERIILSYEVVSNLFADLHPFLAGFQKGFTVSLLNVFTSMLFLQEMSAPESQEW